MSAPVLKDFSEHPCVVLEDGTIKPPIWVPVCGPVTWAADPDGLVATAQATAADGEQCLLSVLFPMDSSDAVRMIKELDFPWRWHDVGYVKLTKKTGPVVGQSGEVYSRFICAT